MIVKRCKKCKKLFEPIGKEPRRHRVCVDCKVGNHVFYNHHNDLKQEIKERCCLKCSKIFNSTGNRLCYLCNTVNAGVAEIYSVNL